MRIPGARRLADVERDSHDPTVGVGLLGQTVLSPKRFGVADVGLYPGADRAALDSDPVESARLVREVKRMADADVQTLVP